MDHPRALEGVISTATPVVAIGWCLLDILHHVHALQDTAKDRVLVVEPRTRNGGDEELRSVRVGPSIGHGQCEWAIVLQGPVELILELATPNALSTCSITLWIASLDHETLNDAVEDSVVVIAVLGMNREVLNSLGALLEEQLNDNITHCCVDRGLFAKRILGPDGGGHSGIFFGGLLIEDVSAVIGCCLWWLTRAENEEPLLLVGCADGEGISHLLTVVLALNNRHTWLHLLLHGLVLENSHAKEPFCLLNLSQHPNQLVRVDVHDLHSDHGRVHKKVARLIKDGLLVHQRWGLAHFLLHCNASAKVESVQVQL
mmetsp:Transcript_92567/g.215086  ORF Transcript_92567/g.215086 Transcript_92567/m.215086 type:complete len:315 (+) Transcript_92567:573-1517(+)